MELVVASNDKIRCYNNNSVEEVVGQEESKLRDGVYVIANSFAEDLKENPKPSLYIVDRFRGKPVPLFTGRYTENLNSLHYFVLSHLQMVLGISDYNYNCYLSSNNYPIMLVEYTDCQEVYWVSLGELHKVQVERCDVESSIKKLVQLLWCEIKQ